MRPGALVGMAALITSLFTDGHQHYALGVIGVLAVGIASIHWRLDNLAS
jgi:hypothetical protein